MKARNDYLIEELVQDPLYRIKPDASVYTRLPMSGRGAQDNWRPVAQVDRRRGYRAIRYKNKRLQLHRVMYRAFVGPLDASLDVNHKDGDPSNNLPANLELVTSSENLLHSYRELDRRPVVGNFKLSPEMAARMRADRDAGATYKTLMVTYGVSKSTVSYIINGKTWKSL